MELVADRFVRLDSGAAFDLASGEPIVLVIAPAGSSSERTRWEERCAHFRDVRYHAFAPLIDYGSLGVGERFEAWRSDGAWSGADVDAERCLADAALVLEAARRSTGRLGRGQVVTIGSRAAVLPDGCAGYCETGEPARVVDSPRPSSAALGLVSLPHGALGAIADMFGEPSVCGVRVTALWGPQGAGLKRAACALAREARGRGLVPIASSLNALDLVPVVGRRSLCIVAAGPPEDAWRALIAWSAAGARPAFVVLVTSRNVPGIRALPLDRFAAHDLAAAVRPETWAVAHRARIDAAARAAAGLPGRFAAALRTSASSGSMRSTTLHVVRAAERSPTYGTGEGAAMNSGVFPFARPAAVGWPPAPDLASWRRRLRHGIEILEHGRRVSGERVVREAMGYLSRRGDQVEAARGALALAESLLARGRAAEAARVAESVKACAGDTDATEIVAHSLVLAGIAATDLLHLDDAETTLRTVLRAGLGLHLAGVVRIATLALTRCLFWKGQYDEAARVLAAFQPASDADAVHAAIERSRQAVGRGDVGEAIVQAAEAQRAAERARAAWLQGHAAYAAGFAHLAGGDYRTAERELAVCVERARRLPIRTLSARLLIAESRRRQGQRAAGLRLVRRLGGPGLSPLVRARIDLLSDLLSQQSPADASVRHVQRTGVAALALFAPAGHERTRRTWTGRVIEILETCQTAETPERVLAQVCAALRAQLRASTTAFVAPNQDVCRVVAIDGSRRDVSSLAARILAATQPVEPHAVRLGIEGGAPVKYGGRTIGALVARWTAGSLDDSGDAAALLSAAALAATAALAELTVPLAAPAAGAHELLGVSDAIADVRRAIDRAAAAPFPVLIQGESGSGKELVARALHGRSGRRDRPWSVVNCASIPDDLLESELFGHARGAFTGAVGERTGVFEQAHQSTLFLDEVGELSARAQAKILRTLQEGEIRRVGENQPRRVDVRIIAATNRDLRAEAAAGRFRADLVFRLDVVRIAVPPLRARRDDILVLAEHLWRELTARVGSRARLSPATLAALARYDWPGNVRELQNVLSTLAVRAPRRGSVAPSALPSLVFDGPAAVPPGLAAARAECDRRVVRDALARAGGRTIVAARELGVTRQGLTKLIARLGLSAAN